jgi:hypothetical protein
MEKGLLNVMAMDAERIIVKGHHRDGPLIKANNLG